MFLAAQDTNCSSISGMTNVNSGASTSCAANTAAHTTVTWKWDAEAACLYSGAGTCTFPYAATNGGPTTGGGAFSATGQCGNLNASGDPITGAVNCYPVALAPTTANASSIPGTNSFSANAQSMTQNTAATGCTAGAVSATWQATCTALACGSQCGDDDDDDDDDDCIDIGLACDDSIPCCGIADCVSGTCQTLDPIIIDLSGLGYRLTGIANGVSFDFFGTGTPMKISWTAEGWDGGFLALDRNGNGRIDNATELFSNITPQTATGGRAANGFLALSVYDQPENGGNGDGWIDEHDSIYSKLLIWVDKNHDGVSEPNELISLQKAGIQRISLNFALSKWKDAYGNVFRYSSQLNSVNPSIRTVYDVLLLHQTTPGAGAASAVISKQ